MYGCYCTYVQLYDINMYNSWSGAPMAPQVHMWSSTLHFHSTSCGVKLEFQTHTHTHTQTHTQLHMWSSTLHFHSTSCGGKAGVSNTHTYIHNTNVCTHTHTHAHTHTHTLQYSTSGENTHLEFHSNWKRNSTKCVAFLSSIRILKICQS